MVYILPSGFSIFNCIIIRNYFFSVDKGMEEAASIDGASQTRIFFSIMLPLSKPVIATVALWQMVGQWNSWFDAMIYISNEDQQPLQLILRRLLIVNKSLIAQGSGDLAAKLQDLSDKMKYAAIVVSTLPIMCLYPFLQKYFNQGVMIGSIKE